MDRGGQPLAMSDEKFPEEHKAAPEAGSNESGDGGANPKPAITPAVAIAFVMFALLGVLIVMGLRNGSAQSTSPNGDLAKAQAELNAISNEYNRERIAMGLRPIEGGSEPMEDIATRLKKDTDLLVSLAASYQKMLGEKDQDLTAAKAEILRSEKLRQSLSAEYSNQQAELRRALVNGSTSDLLRRDLADIKSQRDALSSEISDLREKMKTMSAGIAPDQYADLKRRLDETIRAKDFFENRVKQLEGDLTKTKLFANSEAELLPAAVELFRSLRKLEGKPDSEISSAYSSLGAQLDAGVLMTLNFATGASTINHADEEAIRNLVRNIPDGDLILAIGYASETGNVDANHTLSSDRATAAAELITSVKRPGQFTQAVYLGQTARFSSRDPERNQFVEIWQIRKK